MNVNKDYQPAKYVKAKKDGSSPIKTKKNSTFRTILAILGVLVFIAGTASIMLITKKQDTTPIAPTAPQSKPAAYIEKHETCTLSFDVTAPSKLSCGETGCETDSDCGTGLVCLATSDLDSDNNPIKYCAQEAYEDACIEDPSVTSCCTAQTPEEIACGYSSCQIDGDCEDDLECVLIERDIRISTTDLGNTGGANPASIYCAENGGRLEIREETAGQTGYCIFENGSECEEWAYYEGTCNGTIGYCSQPDLIDTCEENPGYEGCCTETSSELISCGDTGCETDSDCESGLVCLETDDDIMYCGMELYEDACIEDPSEESCCEAPTTITSTPTEPPPTEEVTTVITTVGCNDSCNENADCSNISHICYEGACRLDVNPESERCLLPNGESTIERPVVVPTESGPEEWMQYLKAGLGTLGIGALLLLLL